MIVMMMVVVMVNVMMMEVKVPVMFELLGLRLTMTWYDPFMRWNASEHNNIEVEYPI